jgi:superfamily II DNA or RNA helicase/HKD family nuclease
MPAYDSVLNLPNDLRMLDVVRRGLESADDVRIAVSFTRCSGLGLLIDPLKEVAERGGRVQILTSTYQAITQPEALETLQRLPVETRVQGGAVGFHAKFWWFRGGTGSECWAGSSNLSKGGLATNLEWNLRRVDAPAMEATRRQFEGLWNRDDVEPLSDALIKDYRATYLAATASRPPGPMVASDAVASVAPNRAQVEALGNLAQIRADGGRRAAVIAATGVGKTYLAAFDVLRSGARTALYVSHRLEHLLQARRSFGQVLGSRRSLGIVGGGRDEAEADVVFATVASLGRRPDLVGRGFDYLVIDEFHHVEAPSYEVLRPIREEAFLLGITATPERQDGHDVLAWCDWNVAYEVRLPEAIDRGWLLPFHYFGISDDTVDFLKINWRRLDEVEAALSVEARAAHVLRHALERGFDGPKRATVGFCAGRRHARFMAEAFRRFGQEALAVLGDQPVEDREAVYRRLEDPHDPLQWVFVADVLNEGVDIPAINAVLFLRPTESATVFLQQLGRGLRLFPGTEVLTVLDFVGHHRSAWLTLNALDAPSGGGRRTEIADGVVIKPPAACEVVLERRTREILAKVSRFTTKREACDEAYKRLREEVGRPVLPLDLWNRGDVPDLGAFRSAYGAWIAVQQAHRDEPAWAKGLEDDHPALLFLRAIEANWQAQRVSPYALVWGLSAEPGAPALGYERFFERWPQWRGERSALEGAKTWDTVRRKLGAALVGDRLTDAIVAAMGPDLLGEVEGRLLYTVNGDHQERHGGVLRTPADLHLFARYRRPEIIRHFGVHFDPARHNTGMLWFGDDGVVITKIDTSGAKTEHQYTNRLVDARTFSWTSQNKMATTNEAGRKVVDHEARGLRLHIFVQPGPHEPACYLGCGRVTAAEGDGPMLVEMSLENAVPVEVLSELSR